MMDVDLIFKALANPTRRQILEWLKAPEQFLSVDECGDFKRGVCAGHIERLGKVSQSTMSNHLSVLQQAGLIVQKNMDNGRIFLVMKHSFSNMSNI